MRFNRQHRWKVLAAGVGANVSFSFVVGGVPATAVYLRSSYQLSNSELGLALGILGLGIALSEIPWGLLTDRWGDRPVLLTGLMSMALTLLTLAAYSNHTPTALVLCLGLFATGLLGSSVNGASGRAIMLWFQEQERGLAMSIRQTAVPTGYALGALLMPWLAQHYGFGVVFSTAAALCMLCSGLVWRWIHEPDTRVQTSGYLQASPLRELNVWRAVLAISLLCAPQFTLMTCAAMFFHDRLGLSVVIASLMLALIQVGAIIGRLWSGHWTDRHNNRSAYLKGCAWFSAAAFLILSIVTCVLPIPSTLASVVLPIVLMVAGTLVSIWHGVAYAELATLAGAQRSGTAVAMGNSGAFLSLFLAPIAASAVVSHWGWKALWILCAVCALLAARLFISHSARLTRSISYKRQ